MINVLWLIPFGLVVFAAGWAFGVRGMLPHLPPYAAKPLLDCGCPDDDRAQAGCMHCNRWTCIPHSSQHPHGVEESADVS